MNGTRRQRADRLATRRRDLQLRARSLRLALATSAAAIAVGPPWLRLLRQGWGWARSHRWAVGLPLAAVLVFKPKWAGRCAAAAPLLLRWMIAQR